VICAICTEPIYEGDPCEWNDGDLCHSECLDWEADAFYYNDENGAW
jgi:hypothetical protein